MVVYTSRDRASKRRIALLPFAKIVAAAIGAPTRLIRAAHANICREAAHIRAELAQEWKSWWCVILHVLLLFSNTFNNVRLLIHPNHD